MDIFFYTVFLQTLFFYYHTLSISSAHVLRSHVGQLLASHAAVACRVVDLVNAIHIIFLQVSQTVGAGLGHAQARLVTNTRATDSNDNQI